MDKPTIPSGVPEPETFPRWPHPDLPARDLMNEFRESEYIREWDAWARHLHESEAEKNGWEPQSVEDERGYIRWKCSTVAGWALEDAFELFVNHLHTLYGRAGEVAGWTYWAARDMRDLLNGLLERHDQWRRRALATGYPTGPDDVEEATP